MLSIFLNSLFLLSHLFSPLFKPKQYPPPNINITNQSSSFFLVGCDPGHVLCSGFFFLLWPVLKGRGGYGWVSGLLRLVMGLVEIGVGHWVWWGSAFVGHWVWWSSVWVTRFGGDRCASVAFSSRKSWNLIVEFISSAASYCQRFAPPEIVIVHWKSRQTSRCYHCTVEIPQRKKPRLSLPVLYSMMHRFVIVRHYVFV